MSAPVQAAPGDLQRLQAEVAALRAKVAQADKRDLRRRLGEIATAAQTGRMDGFQVAAALNHAIGAWL